MCGRFTLAIEQEELLARFHLSIADESITPHYNIAPTQNIAVVLNESPDRLSMAQWGFIPSWSRDAGMGSQLINARAETLAEKPTFRSAFRKRRCLVLADGFYEWRKGMDGRTKTPMYARLKNGEPFAMAGLWEMWKAPTGELRRTCTIITTEPNALMSPIHNRMPAILPRELEADWLDDSLESLALLSMLKPYPADQMEVYPVSRRVNTPANDGPALVQPAGGGYPGLTLGK
jgi:putative SOS response-associated peptidase YedK